MSIHNVALIFDNRLRPDTTGGYCLRALKKLAAVKHFLPSQLPQIPSGGFDLYLQIDDGLDYHLPEALHPRAWWAIDTHLSLDWCRQRARTFDYAFTAQRDGAEAFQRDGLPVLGWLPLACDLDIHCKHDLPKSTDICFVGNLFPGPRSELLDLIQRRYSNTFVGRCFFEEMARAYSAARIVFNRSIRNDINMRVFEALACGSLLMTNELTDNGQHELFQDGVHLATYRDGEELLDKIAFYLAREEVRERIAAEGRALVLAKDTYRHRMERLLAEVETQLATTAVPTGPCVPPPPLGGEGSGMRSMPVHSLTSIVILTHNELAYTQRCLESIRRCTHDSYELIVVDNASTDGTREFLQTQSDIKLICNRDNRGFPAAANQGMQAATGDHILLLNNDCVVTTGWLRRLLQALHEAPTIGLVGPVSNCVSGEQQIAVHYQDLATMDTFAQEWAQAHDRQRQETDRLVGFCLLVRREVYATIGLLDERFGIGCFEDDDYCRRALAAGFRAAIAQDAFVHHFGSRTFVGSGVDYAAVMRRGEELFRQKWMERVPAPSAANTAATCPPKPAAAELPPLPRFQIRAAAGGGLRLERRELLLSACLIVRDNERTIEAALSSLKPYVDEIVVVDTGSQDGTAAIARRLGARVFHFPWCDSFSAARNESLRHARGRWLFWMDSDDTIDAENGRKLRELIERDPDAAVLGYIVQVHCPGPGDDGMLNITVVDHVKLFRNRPELRFEGRIHEQILPAIRRLGGAVAWTDIFVIHSGYDHSPEGQERKMQRDLCLLHLEYAEQPDHPFTLFNLGMTYSDIGDYEKAAGFLEQSIQRSDPRDSQVRKAYALLVQCYAQLGRLELAGEQCERGLQAVGDDPELRFRKGQLLHIQGRLSEAAAAYQRVLQPNGKRHFTSVDRGLHGFKTRHNLAMVYTDMGQLDRAEEQWRHIVAEVPTYRDGWRGLSNILLRQGRHHDARTLMNQLLADRHLQAEGWLLQGQLAQAEGKRSEARTAFQQAVAALPADPAPRRLVCQHLFEHGDLKDAERELRALIRCEPKDGSAYHNLGTVCQRQGDLDVAVVAYCESLRWRPRSVPTYLQLGHALWQLGRHEEARASWREVQRLEPHNAEAAQALQQPLNPAPVAAPAAHGPGFVSRRMVCDT